MKNREKERLLKKALMEKVALLEVQQEKTTLVAGWQGLVPLSNTTQ